MLWPSGQNTAWEQVQELGGGEPCAPLCPQWSSCFTKLGGLASTSVP